MPAESQPEQQRPHGRRDFRVVRSKSWLQGSASKVATLITQALPSLLPHPRAAVRVAVATGQLLYRAA